MNLEDETGEYGFTGRVSLEHPLTLQHSRVVMDFDERISPENIEVDIDALPARLTGHEVEMRTAIRDMLSVQLQRERPVLETPNLHFSGYVSDLQVTNLITCFRSCLIIMFSRTGYDHLNSFACEICDTAIRPEASAALVLSTYYVYRYHVCRSFIETFGLSGSADDFFSFPEHSEAHLRDSINIDNFVDDNRVDHTILTGLDITISDGQFNIEGLVTMSGTGWVSHFSFSGSVVLEINDQGHPEFRTDIDTTMIDFRLVWWVWFAGMLGQGNTLAGVGGQIASRIITTIIQNVFARWLSESVNELFPQPDVPNPALPFTLDITDTEIDDLTFYGRPCFPERPREYEGPKVWIDGDFEVTDVQPGGGSHMVVLKVVDIHQTTFKKAHYGAFRVRSSLLVAPFRYNWYLNDVLLEGAATVQVGDAEVRYSVRRNSCELWLASGDSLDTELKVLVGDSRDMTVESPPRRLIVEGSIDLVGVTGTEIVAGPIVELFGKETVIDELASQGLVAPGGPGPDESQSEEPSYVSRRNAFRKALSLGMEMDLSDVPFDG